MALNALREVANLKLPCVTAAYLKTLCGGWNLRSRYQREGCSCRIGCGADDDSLEHYVQCPRYREFFHRSCPSFRGHGSPAWVGWALGIEPLANKHEIRTAVIYLYALYTTYEAQRANDSQKDAYTLMEAHLRALCNLHKHIRPMVNGHIPSRC